jgi:hypothetical protein
MLDGLKVVVLALLLSGVTILAAFVIPDAESDRLSCVTGEAARNPFDEKGAEKVAMQDFQSIEDAESYLCVELPRPRSLDGWEFVGVTAWRTNALDEFGRGEFASAAGSYKRTSLRYLNVSEPSFVLELDIYPRQSSYGMPHEDFCTGEGATQEIEALVQGQRVTFYRGTGIDMSYLVGCWQQGDLRYFADIEFRDEPNLPPDIIGLLESIE